MKNRSVGRVILNTIRSKWLLTAGIVITVVGAIVTALFPPLILAKIIDTITSVSYTHLIISLEQALKSHLT